MFQISEVAIFSLLWKSNLRAHPCANLASKYCFLNLLLWPKENTELLWPHWKIFRGFPPYNCEGCRTQCLSGKSPWGLAYQKEPGSEQMSVWPGALSPYPRGFIFDNCLFLWYEIAPVFSGLTMEDTGLGFTSCLTPEESHQLSRSATWSSREVNTLPLGKLQYS